MSSYEIFKLLEGLDREYLSQAKTTDSIARKKYCQKAHFVINRVRKEFKEKLEERAL